MKRLYITLDTEMDSDVHWTKRYPAEYTSVLVGIPNLLRPLWDKYGVHPIYFLSPEVLYDEQCVQVLLEEIKKGAIIGAHLHPEYIKPDSIWGIGMEKEKPQFPCYDCSGETEKEKLANLTQLIIDKLGVKPEWYRAARFGADLETINILTELGYHYDSSVTPFINWSNKGGPDHSSAPICKYEISSEHICVPAKTREYKQNTIIEMPVTILGRRWGFLSRFLPDKWLMYRWLRPTHMTGLELKRMILQMDKEKINEGVMMFHSMEIMKKKSPYVRTSFGQFYFLKRLECCLKYAVSKGFSL